jgi:hypothetical protein
MGDCTPEQSRLKSLSDQADLSTFQYCTGVIDVTRLLTRLIALFFVCQCLSSVTASQPLLVVLRPTGQERDGLPVLEPHPDAKSVSDVLLRGFSGRLVRLFALEQEFLRQGTGRASEPAYLLLSDRQGGFPCCGFFLNDQKKADVGWVDLHRDSALSGQFGAMDQIFPHELLHIIVRQLVGQPRESGGNQVHAVGVRTDPVVAFGEGFAEHVQILAVDDPAAMPDTQALADDDELCFRAQEELARYARDLNAWFMPIRPSQMRFLLWFSRNEQVQRYHAVKANALARTTAVPDRLLARPDKYAAYLYYSVVPAASDAAPKPAAVMLSIEGVVSHLFWRWTTDRALQERLRDDAFYAQFGTRRADVSPEENVYIKLFYALYVGKPSDTAELVRAYVREFPDDATDVARVVRQALLEQDLPHAPEIWLANAALQTGTSLFDQYRTLPRPHTFDINAATEFDWRAVPGVTPELATRLVKGAPYQRLDDLASESDIEPALREQLTRMAQAMGALRASPEEESLSLTSILQSYLWRLAALIVVATVAGAWLARQGGVARWWAAVPIALVASVLVVALAWIVTCPAWYPLAAPVVLGGLPWAVWRLARRREWRPAVEALIVWIAATLPAMILTRAGW